MTLFKTVAILLMSYGQPLDRPGYTPADYVRVLGEVEAYTGIPPEMMLAVATVESRFNPAAMSRDANGDPLAWGLFQLHLGYAGEVVRQLCGLDPGDCLHTQAQYAAMLLRRCLYKCRTTSAALGAYNTGVCGRNRAYQAAVLRERDYVKSLWDKRRDW